jgi:hypothetical protein
MKIRAHVVLLFAALVFLAGGSGISAQDCHEVEGAVYGPDSKAIANVVVTPESFLRLLITRRITKSDGRYRFSGVVCR